MFKRILDIRGASAKKSIFLFGPRQTGKTFLLRQTFPGAVFYNLLQADQFLRISRAPQLIREELTSRRERLTDPVIIDEMQKLPVLLDEVHDLIETLGIRFILTGSSARKLRRGGANLLGGRARIRHLFPLVREEIPGFDLVRALNYGTLPSIYQSDDPQEDLLAYCGSYLQEEIVAEGAVRGIESFSRFLQTAALNSSELLVIESLANDAQVSPRLLREYLTILEDTLIGTILPPFRKTKRRKAIATAKFYFFDIGVCNTLAGRQGVSEKSEAFGKCFEHFMFTELRAYLDYTRDRRPLQFWRDYTGHEVDFLIGDRVAIEVKATSMVQNKHLKNLRLLGSDIPLDHKIVVSLDSSPRRVDEIDILPWADFLDRLWEGCY